MRLAIFFSLLAVFPAALPAQTPADSVTQSQSIESVVVTARKPLMVYRQTGNISVDVEQLKYAPMFAGEKNIFKFLQLLPGVSAGKDGLSGLLIRGGSNDQTQILFDEVPIYNQAHTYGLLSIFSGETVRSAEVAKGYISPAYGSRLSGLTQIRTRDGDRQQHRQSITIGTLALAGTLDGPLIRNKGSYLLSARYFFPEAVLSLMNNEIRYGFYDLTGKLNYDIHRNHTLTLGIYSGDDHMRNKGDSQTWNVFGWGNTTASLRLESCWSPNLRSMAVVYYTFLQNRQRSQYESGDPEIFNSGKTTSKTDEFGVRLKFDHRITKNYSLDYGLNLSHQRFFPMNTETWEEGICKQRSYPMQQLLSGALFLENKLQWKALILNIGLRGTLYDNMSSMVFAIEPRVLLSYDMGRDNAIWASATINSQAITQFNRYYYSMPIDFWSPFQDGRLQRSWQGALGGRTRLHDNLTLSVEAYYKKMQNLSIIYDSDDYMLGHGGFIYGSGRAFGVEAMIQYQTKRLGLTASYTFTDSRRKSSGISYPFEYDIPHDFNLFLNYDAVKQPNRKHTLSLNVSWRTGLPYRLTNETYPDVDGRPIVGITIFPTMRMHNYFRADISYNMERRKKNGVRNWQFSIMNVTGHKNPISIYPDGKKFKAMVLIPFMPSISYTRTFGNGKN